MIIQANPAGNLMGIGTIEVGQARFPVEPILLTLRQLWPFGGVNTIVTGSIQIDRASNGKIITRIVVILNSGNQVNSWEVTHQGIGKASIDRMLRELAFKITYLVVPSNRISVKTWEGLQYLTQTIIYYNKYSKNKDKRQLDKANRACQQAIKYELFKKDVKNNEISKTLQELFYQIGLAFLLEKQYRKAEEIFYLLTNNFNSSSFHTALGNTFYAQSKFDLAIDRYECSIRINRDAGKDNEPDPYLGLGSVYIILGKYKEALKQYRKARHCDNKLWKSYYNQGKIYLYHKYINTNLNYNKYYYKCARKIFQKGLQIVQDNANINNSQNRNQFYLYSVLGLAYLFQAVYDTKLHNNERNDYLKQAQENAEKSAYLNGEVDFIFWNLGIVRLGLLIDSNQIDTDAIINKALSAWKRALLINQKSKKLEKTEDKDGEFKKIIYENIIGIFGNSNLISQKLYQLAQLLKEQEFASGDPYFKIRRKVLKKDLNVLLQILEQSHQHQKHQKYEQPLKQLSYLLNVNDEEKSWKNSILLCCLFLY
jgi:tetratricopeptide (TPR) repeat protein